MISPSYYLLEFYLNPVLKKRVPYRFETTKTEFVKKNKVVNNCTRNVDITYLGKIKNLFAFDVFTWEVIFTQNDIVVEERLLSKFFWALKNIMLGVSDKGEIEKIYNLVDMQNEWTATISNLREDYEGNEFNLFLSDITEVLESEEKTIQYLKSKNMFGMYFHGLFGKNDIPKIPIKRKVQNFGFRNSELTEEIWPDNRIPGFIIRAKKNSNTERKIISTGDEILGYQGKLEYDKDNKLIEADLKIESEKLNINYNIVWVG